MSSAPPFGYGVLRPGDAGSRFNILSFLIQQALGRVSTMKVVKVNAVTADPNGGPPTVDVQPLVNQLDGQGNATPHGTIFGIPVWRMQAGATAIILDPVIGDIGLLICADRDISAVKAAKAAANPGSLRRFDPADGVYLGAILGASPTTSVQFSGTTLTIKGDVHVTGTVIAGFGGADQVNLQTHKQSGVSTGGSVSGPPVAGT